MKQKIEIHNQVRINGKVEIDNHIQIPTLRSGSCAEQSSAPSESDPGRAVNEQLALDLCCMSIQTYRDYDEKNIVSPEGWSFRDRINGSGWTVDGNPDDRSVRKGLIFERKGEPGTYVFAFRGTRKIIEWVQNAFFFFTPFHGYKETSQLGSIEIHKGFMVNYKSIRAQLAAKYSDLKPKKLYITGHSLGGALATLFHLDVAHSNFKNTNFNIPQITHYNFASPRVGNEFLREMLRALGQEVRRWANLRDLVVHVPGEDIGYLHAGPAIALGFGSKNTPSAHYAENYHKELCEIYAGTVGNCKCTY